MIAGTMAQTATLTLDVEGVHHTRQDTGNGPVDAIFNAIRAIVPHTAELEHFQVHAVTGGSDAQGEVTVQAQGEGRPPLGHRPRRRSGYARGLRPRLYRGAEQAWPAGRQGRCAATA